MFDLAVIGAGPGGYTAADEAARRGKSVVLFERDLMGGSCLNRGCIPTKALLHAAETYHQLQHSQDLGIHVQDIALDFAAMHQRKAAIVAGLRDGVAKLMKRDKVEVVAASAQVLAASEEGVVLQAADATYQARELIVASGSVPSCPPIPGSKLAGVLSSNEVIEGNQQDLPSLIIVGGGVIGVECAEIYAKLGRKVTILEAMERILPPLDKDISQRISIHLKKLGVSIETSARVEEILQADATDADGVQLSREGHALTVRYTNKKGVEQQVSAAGVLLATGRVAETAGLFAEGLTPTTQRGALVCDNDGRTSLPHVWAIGDVRFGNLQLAHVAMAQARDVVRALFDEEPLMHEDVVPSCVYTSPEVASVGLTEAQAKERGLVVKTAKSVTGSNPKSLIEGGDAGYLKLVCSADDGRLLGAQLVCPRATELIAELALAVAQNMSARQLASVIHAHPTVSELIFDTAFQLL